MKKKTVKQIFSAIQQDAPDTNTLLVTTSEEAGVLTAIHGDTTQIAMAWFVSLYNENDPAHANQLYGIIKNVVCNMLEVPSPMSNDLVKTLRPKLEEYGKEE